MSKQIEKEIEENTLTNPIIVYERMRAENHKVLQALKACRNILHTQWLKTEPRTFVWGEHPTFSWVIEETIRIAEGR